MIKTPERFLWAAEIMNIQPNDIILEIGCGAGLLAEQIAGRLSGGKLTAIDKSLPMIEKAKKRNQKYIEQGIVDFEVTDFIKSALPISCFDSIVAFNVNFFWKKTISELELIKRTLKNNGRLYIFYQAPFEINLPATDPIKKNLVQNLFNIVDIKLKRIQPTSAICVVAEPNLMS